MQPSIEFRDPSDLPVMSYHHHPMEDVEPESDQSKSAGFAADVLSDALIFLADAKGSAERSLLPTLGLRALGLLQRFDQAFKFTEHFTPYMCDDETQAEGRAKLAKIWHWLGASGSKLSDFGVRGMVLLYFCRLDLVEGATLESIAKLNGTTRQNIDKLVCDLRDSVFNGLRNRQMKEEKTRDRCRAAQQGGNVSWDVMSQQMEYEANRASSLSGYN